MKVVQIGVGGFGRVWTQLLSEYPGVDLVALVDVDEDTLIESAALTNVTADRCFTDLPDAFEVVTAEARKGHLRTPTTP